MIVHAGGMRLTRMTMHQEDPGQRSNRAERSPGITFGGVAGRMGGRGIRQVAPSRIGGRGRHSSARSSALLGNAPSTVSHGQDGCARDPDDHHERRSQQIARQGMDEAIDDDQGPKQSTNNEDLIARHPVSLPVRPPGLGPSALSRREIPAAGHHIR